MHELFDDRATAILTDITVQIFMYLYIYIFLCFISYAYNLSSSGRSDSSVFVYVRLFVLVLAHRRRRHVIVEKSFFYFISTFFCFRCLYPLASNNTFLFSHVPVNGYTRCHNRCRCQKHIDRLVPFRSVPQRRLSAAWKTSIKYINFERKKRQTTISSQIFSFRFFFNLEGNKRLHERTTHKQKGNKVNMAKAN